MSDLTYTPEQLQALRNALARGESRITFDGKSVDYRSVDELKAAIREVELALYKDAVGTGLLPRPARQIRITTKKGF